MIPSRNQGVIRSRFSSRRCNMSTPSSRAALLPLILFALAPLHPRAQAVPTTINYQGRLTDNTPSQAPVTATVNMTFEIWDAPSTGTRLWIEPAAGAAPVVVTGG